MGGRVAEELSEWGYVGNYGDLTSPTFRAVYGPQNVTSGASSDLRHATSTANAMVKVTDSAICFGSEVVLNAS